MRKAILPASLPFMFVGLRIGSVRAVKGMVLAEMLLASTGLGGLIVEHSAAFRMDRVLAVIIAIVVIGVMLSGVVQLAERWFMRWRQDPRGATA
jgi:ABC-type nitrate/sulfonate/bicarbonate transport system permease component